MSYVVNSPALPLPEGGLEGVEELQKSPPTFPQPDRQLDKEEKEDTLK